MDRSEIASAKCKISIDILLKEFDRVVWEIHNRVEYRQRLMNLQLVLAGALAGAYATTMVKDLPGFTGVIWHILPAIIVIFSVFWLEIATQDYYRFTAASYINTYLRPKINETIQSDNLIEWESHLRTTPMTETTKKPLQAGEELLRVPSGALLRTPVRGLGFETTIADVMFSALVVITCFSLEVFHLLDAIIKEGWGVWWDGLINKQSQAWLIARVCAWAFATLVFAYSFWCWLSVGRLRKSIVSPTEVTSYCKSHRDLQKKLSKCAGIEPSG
jgi:hypothetical protein